MNKLVVTTCVGSFVIKHGDGSFRILEEKRFTNKEIIDQPTKYEQELLAKHGAILLKPDVKNFKQLYAGVSAALASGLSDLRKNNLAMTKRAIKLSVTQDNTLIQTSNSISEITKMLNLLAKRLREWYGYTLPEFVDTTESHESFINALATFDRPALMKKLNIREEETMGAALDQKDLEPVHELAQQLNTLVTLRKKHEAYLEKTMRAYCANVTSVAGVAIGAKLIAKAGSLKRLSQFPASTVQLLGAEKALFRHLRTGARSPKYGLIFEHDLVGKLDKKSRGKMARCLADKISIAAKVDYFKGKFVGEQLKRLVEKRCNELRGRK
ncbi:MAG: NOP5/NOP56 family protein [Candidatus Woesearchaeota archaeon]|nr:NOP5/NOP56 family protein [Candidatus Woesearchaeota archaeon]